MTWYETEVNRRLGRAWSVMKSLGVWRCRHLCKKTKSTDVLIRSFGTMSDTSPHPRWQNHMFTAYRFLSCRVPTGWTMPRGRPHASVLRQVDTYLGDMDVTGPASAWTVARWGQKYRRNGGCGDALLRRMFPCLTCSDF